MKGAAASGIAFCSCGMLDAARRAAEGRHRLPVKVNGKRVKTVDVHSHCLFHEAIDLIGDEADKVLPPVKGVPEHFIVIEQRLKEMDAMAIDMEVLSINPFWYGKDRDIGGPDRQGPEREAGRALRRAAGTVRRLRLTVTSVSRSCSAATGDRGQEAGSAGRRDRRQRAGRGFFRSEIPSGLGQGGRTRRRTLHPSAEHAGTRQALQGQWLAVQHDRQSAGHHDRPAAPDFRGHARSLSRASRSSPRMAAAISAPTPRAAITPALCRRKLQSRTSR